MVMSSEKGFSATPFRGSGKLTMDNEFESYTQLYRGAYSSSGAIDVGGFADMDATLDIVMTLADPGQAGIFMVLSSTVVGGGKSSVVTTATAAGFDGTNNTATFNAAGETLILMSISATRWVIVENVGAVGMSAV